MKMIGKPYVGELQVRFDEGSRPSFHGRFYTGTKLEIVDTAKDLPTEQLACSLLYPMLCGLTTIYRCLVLYDAMPLEMFQRSI